MLLSNAYDPDPRVRQEALALTAMGCRVRILAWDRDLARPALESVEGIDVERVFVASTHGRGSTQMLRYVGVYGKMLWRGLRTSFDAVHAHDLDTLPVAWLLGRLRRRPIVYDAHESFPDMLEGSVPGAVQRALARLESFLMRRCDLVITVGEKLRRHLDAQGARRSVVLGNWKRRSEFSRSADESLAVRHRLGIPDNGLTVVCVTQLRPDRKIDELLAASQQCPDVYVIIAGQGALADRVKQAAAANPRILFVGFVTGRQIAEYTCAADVIYYGFDPENPNARFSAPNKLYEALAAGRPLITGDFGEIADVVRDAKCGIVLPAYSAAAIADALTTLSNSAVRAEMAANAGRVGRTSLNWEKGEEILYREYSMLLPGLRSPLRDGGLEFAEAPVAGR
jgi:glycosyltransferase involved in cell wall biosynthesis